MGRGSRPIVRWRKDRQRKKKAREKRGAAPRLQPLRDAGRRAAPSRPSKNRQGPSAAGRGTFQTTPTAACVAAATRLLHAPLRPRCWQLAPPRLPRRHGRGRPRASMRRVATSRFRSRVCFSCTTLPGSERVLARVGPRTVFGSSPRLAVVGESGDWLAVISAKLGNRVRGFVLRSNVRLVHVPFSVEVDQSSRRLTVWRNGIATTADRRGRRCTLHPHAAGALRDHGQALELLALGLRLLRDRALRPADAADSRLERRGPAGDPRGRRDRRCGLERLSAGVDSRDMQLPDASAPARDAGRHPRLAVRRRASGAGAR